LPHPEIIEASEVGHVLLIDDGKMKLVVVGKGPGYLDCEVVVAGTIKDRKGEIKITHLYISFSNEALGDLLMICLYRCQYS
jgi:pyruvate kinase